MRPPIALARGEIEEAALSVPLLTVERDDVAVDIGPLRDVRADQDILIADGAEDVGLAGHRIGQVRGLDGELLDRLEDAVVGIDLHREVPPLSLAVASGVVWPA